MADDERGDHFRDPAQGASTGGAGTDPGRDTGEDFPRTPWPPAFPHTEIDGLLERLDRARALDEEDLRRALHGIVREAQRLRSTVVRLSAAKLSEAEMEARQIVAEARTHADSMRSAGFRALTTRLEEADDVSAAVRASMLHEEEWLRRGRARRRTTSDDDRPGRPT